MKYYEFKENKQKKFDELMEQNEIFFAFSKKQIEENKKENTEYYFLESGMFCPKKNYKKFMSDWDKLDEELIIEAKKLFSSNEIIIYELSNHEYCITYDLSDTEEALRDFNFTDEEYRNAIKEYRKEIEC